MAIAIIRNERSMNRLAEQVRDEYARKDRRKVRYLEHNARRARLRKSEDVTE